MQPLMPVLISFLLSLGIILAVDLITTQLRRKIRKTAHTEGEPTERKTNGSTD